MDFTIESFSITELSLGDIFIPDNEEEHRMFKVEVIDESSNLRYGAIQVGIDKRQCGPMLYFNTDVRVRVETKKYVEMKIPVC